MGNNEATVSTLASSMNGMAAMWGVKIVLDANGKRYVAGMGVNVTTEGGITQSEILFQADRLMLLNNANGAMSSPFFITGGTVYMSSAMIQNASIGTAKIADAAITAAKIGVAEVDTLRIKGNAVTVPVGAFAGASSVSVTVTMDSYDPVFVMGSLTQSYQSDITLSRNGSALWVERPTNSTIACRGVMDYPGPGTHTYTLSSTDGRNTNGTSILVIVCKR